MYYNMNNQTNGKKKFFLNATVLLKTIFHLSTGNFFLAFNVNLTLLILDHI